MNLASRSYDEKRDNNHTRTTFWIFAESALYSLQSAILLLVVTNTGGLQEAGLFTLAYTLTQMLVTIGNFGMRNFQVSDTNEEYSFATYFTSRIFSVFAMVMVCISYALLQGYSKQKFLLVIILCVYRMVDAVEDVFHGAFQKARRLDVASKIASTKIMVSMVTFSVLYIFFHNILIACIGMTIVAAFISFTLNRKVLYAFDKVDIRIETENVWKLLGGCFPICLGDFFYSYLVNAPKYAIDRIMTEESQALFSILFMPVFAINVLSSIVLKPMIVDLSIAWNGNERSKFMKTIASFLGFLMGITLICASAGKLVGTQILGAMYGIDLHSYANLFTVLIIFGGIAAIDVFLAEVLTIIRKQKYILLSYIIATMADFLFIDRLVRKLALWGAAVSYGIAMGIVTLVLGIIIAIELNKHDKMHSRKGKEELI